MKKAFQQLNKVPDPTASLEEEFVLNTRPGLLKLFSSIDDSVPENKFAELSFDSGKEKLPHVIWTTITYGHREWNIPAQAKCRVQVGVYRRKAKMTVSAPKKDVLCRIILNYGYDERYCHQETTKGDNGKTFYANVKETVARSNTAMLLGPYLLSNHSIYVRGDPNVNLVPENVPTHIAQSHLSPAAGRTQTIRPRKYQRITVVLDYTGTDHMIQDFMELLDTENGDDENPLAGLINKITGKDSKIKIPKSTKSLNAFVESLKQQAGMSSTKNDSGEKNKSEEK